MFEVMLGSGKVGTPSMFIGEVQASEFITGDALATAVRLTAGVSQNSTAGWLKFVDTVDGKTKYIAKRPMQYSISWLALDSKKLIFGETTVVINGDTYKVRLLSGATQNITSAPNGNLDLADTLGCEWNRLMYPITSKDSGGTGSWANYSAEDLRLLWSSGYGYGYNNWCQETTSHYSGRNRVIRGGPHNVYQITQRDFSDNASNLGWRPVLELVE